MTNLSENLLKAMEMIAANKKDNGAVLIQAVVTRIIDSGDCKYEIKYADNAYFEAYSMNSDITFSVGEDVYVLVQDGDFSRRKLILGGLGKTPNTTKIEIDKLTEKLIIY